MTEAIQESSEKRLSGVIVSTHNISADVQAWVKALIIAGASEYNSEDTLMRETALKVAVIIDNDASDEEVIEIMKSYENVFTNPALSIRFFLLSPKWRDTNLDPNRVTVVSYMDISPRDFANKVNRILYKARLPRFLRSGFDIEIYEELLEIENIKYRKITISGYVLDFGGEKKLEYQTLYLYIHNKELYEITEMEVRKIEQGGSVMMRKGNHMESGDTRFDGLIPIERLRDNSIED